MAYAVAFLLLSFYYAALTTFIAEQFGTSVRYSGSALAGQLGAVLGGGLAPLIATALLAATGTSTVVAAYVALTLLISLVSTLALPETAQQELAS